MALKGSCTEGAHDQDQCNEFPMLYTTHDQAQNHASLCHHRHADMHTTCLASSANLAPIADLSPVRKAVLSACMHYTLKCTCERITALHDVQAEMVQ